MKLQLLRNATQILTVKDKRILIDPMLGPKDAYDPIIMTDNGLRNPRVPLPVDPSEVVANIDAVLLTHIHNDHWDPVARELLRKDIPLLCQPVDENAIRDAGFTHVIPVTETLVWEDIRISRTSGQHGTGEIGKLMGHVSGYVIEDGAAILYIAGDTIWCPQVKAAIDQYTPTHIVLNGGGAQFIKGDPIVMDIKDIQTVCDYTPYAKIHIVHLEAVNHAKQSRADIKKALPSVFVPDDGEIIYI